MKDIDSEKVYIRLEPAESIEYKKRILEILINLIQSQIISKRFGEIRKAEVKMVRQLNIHMGGMHTDLDQIFEQLPKRAHAKREEWDEKLKARKRGAGRIGTMEEEKEAWGKKEFMIPKTTSKEKRYQMELERIKAMLGRLG